MTALVGLLGGRCLTERFLWWDVKHQELSWRVENDAPQPLDCDDKKSDWVQFIAHCHGKFGAVPTGGVTTIRLILQPPGNVISHANSIILGGNQAWRIESYGATPPHLKPALLDAALKSCFAKSGIVYGGDLSSALKLCAVEGLQQIQEKEKRASAGTQPGGPEGYCQAWTTWIYHQLLLHPTLDVRSVYILAAESLQDAIFLGLIPSLTDFIARYAFLLMHAVFLLLRIAFPRLRDRSDGWMLEHVANSEALRKLTEQGDGPLQTVLASTFIGNYMATRYPVPKAKDEPPDEKTPLELVASMRPQPVPLNVPVKPLKLPRKGGRASFIFHARAPIRILRCARSNRPLIDRARIPCLHHPAAFRYPPQRRPARERRLYM